MKLILTIAASLALDAWAGISPVAPWVVEARCGENVATLAVDPPQRVVIADERHDALPVFNRKRSGWVQGERLNGVRAFECSVRFALEASSVKLRAASYGRELVRGVDYELNPEWGTVGWVSKEKDCGAVLANYAYRQRRVDAVVCRADGAIALRKGEPHACNPAVPSCASGETLLGTVYVDATTSRLTDDSLFPGEPPAAKASPLAFNPPKRTLAKLRAGRKVKILAWGDSVTVGFWLKPQEKWQEQFVHWLKSEYPDADIELVSNGWAGRKSETFLRQLSGSKYNFRETVLDVKPDLVISEFVNDAARKEGIVEETYAKKILPAFRECGIDWIVLTPHYTCPDMMGMKNLKDCDNDPRPFVKALREFARREGVGLADASLLWGGLWRRGIPYQTLLVNDINHPNAFGMTLFVEALKPLFSCAENPQSCGIYDLRCEYQAEPLGVVNPRFFWKYVGNRPEKFTLTVYDGKGVVATHETKEHLYVEPSMELSPFHRYWWRVEGAGDSATGTFVTGIREWRMPFFKPGWKREALEYWVARKDVELHGAKSVVIALASLGTHRLYVNGKPASDGSGPNRSHIEDGILLAETYDVTRLVKDGVNEFAVYMDDGWARLRQCKEKESCLGVDGRAETDDGVVAIDSSSPWRVAKSRDRAYGPVAANAWSHGKVRRGIERLHDVETLTDESDGVLRTGRPFAVASDSSPRNRVVRKIRPVSIEPHGDGWKIDMGEAFTGFMRLRLKGENGTSARMTVSDNFVDECNFGQAFEFVFCGGDGVFENRMDTQSGRFFYLTGCERPSSGDVEGSVVSCAGLRSGGFSGDKDLERILSLDADTFVATTFGGVTVDCPHRERLGYGEASLSSMWGAGLPLFDTAAFYGAYLLKWASSQRPDGSIPHVSPNGWGWGGTFWSCFPVYGLAEYCRFYPDARLKESMRPVIDRWLDYLDSHVKGGLLEQYEPKKGGCLGDWAYPEVWEKKKTWGDWGHTTEGKFFNNCSYAWAIRLALETEGLVADPSRREELKRRHAALVAAIDREWYRDGIYVSPDARYQAIALVCGAAEAGGHAVETERATLDIVERKGYVDGGSPSYTVILRVLCRSDRGRELALRTLRRREAPSFLFFADEGYNTIPESWRYGHDSHGSMMHTCYTGPAGMLMRGFAGFDVNGSEINVSPLLSDALPDFSAYTETLYGTLSVKVATKDGGRIVEVNFPDGCNGRFIAHDETYPLNPGINRFEIQEPFIHNGMKTRKAQKP